MRILLAVVGAAWLAMYCSHEEKIGGRWEARHQDTLPEAGAREYELYRADSWRSTRVASGVAYWRYYDSDCLAYVTQRPYRAFVGCGAREPVELDTTSVKGEILIPTLTEQGIEFRATGESRILVRFSGARVIAEALRQPPRGTTNGAAAVPPD